MFRNKRKVKLDVAYDREMEQPVLRCSICTGEQVAGFRNVHTGKFRDVMLIRCEADLELFREACGVTEVQKIY